MTQKIDLQKGLEALYTFDNADTDGQRNRLLDRSGNGNHGDLNGGVTTGTNSKVGEAYSFDGSDDNVTSSNFQGWVNNLNDEFSVFVLFKVNSLSSTSGVLNSGQGPLSIGVETDGSIRCAVNYTDAGNDFYADGSVSTAEWVTASVVSSISEGSIITRQGNDVINLRTPNGTNYVKKDYITMGADAFGNNLSGNIAAAGFWTKALSKSEIEQLNRQTDRMVNYL